MSARCVYLTADAHIGKHRPSRQPDCAFSHMVGDGGVGALPVSVLPALARGLHAPPQGVFFLHGAPSSPEKRLRRNGLPSRRKAQAFSLSPVSWPRPSPESARSDRHALVGGAADEPGLVEGLNGEIIAPALVGGERGFRPDAHAHRRGREVLDADLRADGGNALLQGFSDGVAGGLLHQRHQRRRGEHGKLAAGHGSGGVFVVDDPFCGATCILLSFPGAGSVRRPASHAVYLRISAPKFVSSALRILSMLACISASVSVRSPARKVSA